MSITKKQEGITRKRKAKNTISISSALYGIDKPTLYLLGLSFIAIIVSIFLPKWGFYHMMFFNGFIFSAIAIGIEVYNKGINNKVEAFGFGMAFVMLYLVTLAPVVICFLMPAFIVWRIIKNIFPTVCIILLIALFVLYMFLMIILYPERLFDGLFYIQHGL